ncbi:MAG: HAD family hydrolase [Candidatus Pristimantibacillus lignocellulolyticus]|uniref:HAD family hydrolase n=1 Tax=Candidatus Pristimantibacillus lignocellulolyticus TaxID=2994561 RepID=A0A9J6ZCR2_9BACL|nr:MAG: HAD family hydrolase [Candidatus Pristimantibacillus lignocellulolyticus]
MSQQILFDLDDTLIYCNRYFFRAIDKFAEQVVSWFNHPMVTIDEVKTKQTQLDTLLIAESGFKSEHFPQSFIETYYHYCQLIGRASSPIEIDTLQKLGRAVYGHETEAYPHMEDTLKQLTEQGHQLHLYTGGEQKIQLRKIQDMSLDRYFDDRIYIRQLKNIAALDELLTANSFERERTWMIGNSIRNDIVPALSAGIHAIHVVVPDEWCYNIIDVNVEPKGQFLSVQSLQQIPPFISRY